MKKIIPLTLLLILFLVACVRKTPAPITTPTVIVGVAPTVSVPVVEITQPPNCTDSAAFVADVTVPDGTTFGPGESFTKTWRIENTGTCAWTDQYQLVFASGDQLGATETVSLPLTKPNVSLDLSINLIAPDTDGSYRGNFELHDSNGTAVPIDNGVMLWVEISVGNVE